MVTDVLSEIRTLCITLQQNPVGAVCVVALSSIGLAACSLELARRAASLASDTYAKSEVINPRRAARARRPQAEVTDRQSIRPRRGPLHLVSCELHFGIN